MKIASVFLLLLVATVTVARSESVVVQTWHYDQQTRLVTVRLLNESDKDVTAFSLSVTVKVDGKTNVSEKTADYLPLMASVANNPDMAGKHGNGTFAAKTSRDITFQEPEAPTDVSVVLDVVAYADHSADVKSESAFNTLVNNRNAMVLAIQQSDKAIKEASSGEAAATELTRLADLAKGKGISEVVFRERAAQARQTDPATLAKENETRLALYSAHAQLVKQ